LLILSTVYKKFDVVRFYKIGESFYAEGRTPNRLSKKNEGVNSEVADPLEKEQHI
jgi:hypothetical protein